MATELLYQQDSFLRRFTGRVTAVDREQNAAALDVSAFYPGGGGQPCDLGELLSDSGAAWKVAKVSKDREGLVWHRLEDGPALPEAGERVEGVLDWDRRYRLMRTHTALHILCGVVFRDYGALVTGGDMEPLQGRMDFEFESLHKELVQVIEAAVNVEIRQARPIWVRQLAREAAFAIPDLIRTKINLLPEGIAEVRVVEITGLDLQADGGTHVANTAEVGRVRVLDYKSKGKINKRLYIEVDSPADL